MSVTRSVVEMVTGKVKTEASQKTVPLDDFMIEELLAWYRITPYQKPEDWVFASDSPRAGARTRQAALLADDDHADVHQTGGEKAGHRQYQLAHLRHTYSCLLHANGERPQGRARATASLFHQGHDGHLHASGDFCETEGTVEGSADDRSQTHDEGGDAQHLS